MERSSFNDLLTDIALLDLLPVAVYICDCAARIVRFNPCAAELWGHSPSPDDRYCGSPCMIRPDDSVLPHDESPIAQVLRTGEAVRDAEVIVQRADGSRTPVSVRAVPLFDSNGGLLGAIAVLEDVTKAKGAMAQVQEATRTKDDVLATVAHELRQPIQASVAALGVMARRPDRERGERARETVERQIRQMNRIVEDLLNGERAVNGHLELRREIVDLRTIVNQVIDAVEPVFAERDQALEVCLPDLPVLIIVDPARIQQVLMNVLTNATKYTAPNGQISLRVVNQGATVDIAIADTGRGLNATALSRIFELFTREADDSGGYGVGLAVARRLVEMHGGTIVARSDGPGRGSEFVISLPTASEPI